jgi:dTDP-4-amino-4,6-dideoxygalactose transaminase
MSDLERQLLLKAFDSNWVTSVGENIDAFEVEMAEHLGVERVVAVASGTAALHLALVALGIGPGDLVIIPSFTFAATANAVMYTGAEPIFLDCSPTTWTIDPDLLAEELARRFRAARPVRAVIPVDLFGQCCDYDALLSVCAEYNVSVVEDAAEALGSTYRDRAAGSFGDMGILSFNGNKILTTGGGGMVVTDSQELADEVRYLSTQARDPVPHYEHRKVGFNYRMNNLLAGIGRAQLSRLNDLVAARRRIRETYREHLAGVPGLELMPLADYGASNCWLTCLLVDPPAFGATPEDIRTQLAFAGIEIRPTWKPMHLQPVYAKADMVGGAVCEDLFARGLCLPSGSALTADQQCRVIDTLLAAPKLTSR